MKCVKCGHENIEEKKDIPLRDGMVYHSDGGGYLKYDPNAAETIMTPDGPMTYCPHSGGYWFYTRG